MDSLTGQEVYVVAQEPDVYTDADYYQVLGVASSLAWATHYVNQRYEALFVHSKFNNEPGVNYRLLPLIEDDPDGYRARVEYTYDSGRTGLVEMVCFTITRHYINK